MQDFSGEICQNLVREIRKMVKELPQIMTHEEDPQDPKDSSEIRETLQQQIDVCKWDLLDPHYGKGDFFLVSFHLDFLDVATAIAENDVARVNEWIESAAIVRPDLEKVTLWKSVPDKEFRLVIVKPFVLIQEVIDS